MTIIINLNWNRHCPPSRTETTLNPKYALGYLRHGAQVLRTEAKADKISRYTSRLQDRD